MIPLDSWAGITRLSAAADRVIRWLAAPLDTHLLDIGDDMPQPRPPTYYGFDVLTQREGDQIAIEVTHTDHHKAVMARIFLEIADARQLASDLLEDAEQAEHHVEAMLARPLSRHVPPGVRNPSGGAA